MKKQILFLFAASALFAACSSDDMPNGNQGGDDNGQTVVEENLPSSFTATTEEGIGVNIGAMEAKAGTRTSSDQVSFTVVLPDDILDKWDSYVLAVDDFAIRYDGEYLKIQREEGSDNLSDGKVKITRQQKLGVKIEGLENIEPAGEDRHEVTFEAYLWIDNKQEVETVDGLTYGERFTWDDKVKWIGLDPEGSYVINEDTERGWDATQAVANSGFAYLESVAYNNDEPPYGYGVRYNVYRGLQGTQYDESGELTTDNTGLGNTPYFKISVHVNRLADDTETQIVPVIPD